MKRMFSKTIIVLVLLLLIWSIIRFSMISVNELFLMFNSCESISNILFEALALISNDVCGIVVTFLFWKKKRYLLMGEN
jgi:hypothetical protein